MDKQEYIEESVSQIWEHELFCILEQLRDSSEGMKFEYPFYEEKWISERDKVGYKALNKYNGDLFCEISEEDLIVHDPNRPGHAHEGEL